MFDNNKNVSNAKKNKTTSRRYDTYGKTEYNARICIIKIK